MNTAIELISKLFTEKSPVIVLVLVVGVFAWILGSQEHESEIHNIKLNIVRIDGRVDNLEEDIREIKIEIKEMKSDITDIKMSVAKIEAILLKKSP